MASHLKIIHIVLGFISQNVISMASYLTLLIHVWLHALQPKIFCHVFSWIIITHELLLVSIFLILGFITSDLSCLALYFVLGFMAQYNSNMASCLNMLDAYFMFRYNSYMASSLNISNVWLRVSSSCIHSSYLNIIHSWLRVSISSKLSFLFSVIFCLDSFVNIFHPWLMS
jgi:uncharacterized membrane protein SirB2